MRLLPLAFAGVLALHSTAWAFCGFYVATADEPLVNKASRVVLVRRGEHTVVTMASDVHGDPKQFALVIPVPTVIRREQVRIVKPEIVEHLEEYSKPRLVQYFDTDPCMPPAVYGAMAPPPLALAAPARMMIRHAPVRIEAAFSVEEYDILVLSADDSAGLIAWLNRNGYKMPADAGPVVGSYLKQHMHFFVAKVNLERMKNNPTGFLRPIRVDYDTRKFMLPIRLGTVNAQGQQDMIVLALTTGGRVDVTNYRTVRMPTGVNIPEYVSGKFGAFYDAVFARQLDAAAGSAVFLEYAWPIAANVGLCDPCSSMPMRQEELDELGASWPAQPGVYGGAKGFITRLHVRYDRAHFPEDLQFQETPDTETYQARYIIQVAVKRRDLNACAAGRAYLYALADRWGDERRTLADLTGWSPADIRHDMVAQWEQTREQ
jgi:hypothetical protein